MDENPYAPPLPEPPDAASPTAATRVSPLRVLVVACSMVVAPLLIVGTYVASLMGMLYLDFSASLSGNLGVFYTAMVFVVPIWPAFLMGRKLAQWIDAPHWWDAVILILSVGLGITLLVIFFA